MTHERRLNPMTLEDVTNTAQQEALRYGGHAPILIVEGTRGSVVAQVELPDTHEERMVMMRSAGYVVAQGEGVGALHQVFFICEAWISLAERDQPPVTPPSQDPNRIEALIISGLNVEEPGSRLVAFEMIRDGEGTLAELKPLDEAQKEGLTVDSPLLDAFARGFLQGIRLKQGRLN